MKWLRQQIRWGVRLALLALVVQMAVSFSHVHAEWLTSTSTLAATDASDGPVVPAVPDYPNHVPKAHDFCAICASIGLFGVLVLPVASELPPLAAFTHILDWHAAVERPREAWSSPQARAPPSA
jgi:hypothetical protein